MFGGGSQIEAFGMPTGSSSNVFAESRGSLMPFKAISGTDTMTKKNGGASSPSQINSRHQCITCMKEYENKSLEELRLEHYQLNSNNGAEVEAEPDLEEISGQICGVICCRPDYYCKPELAELDKRMDRNGNCIVLGFEIGRQNYGRIKFLEAVNVTNVNLDEIIIFRHKKVIVYPEDDDKPELGKGPNVPAEIELERIFPPDKGTKYSLLRNAEGYKEKLQKICDELGAQLIFYDEIKGILKFKVDHFSKYGIEDIEEDEDKDNGSATGLGGISQKNLKSYQPVVFSPMGPAGDAVHRGPLTSNRDLAAQVFISSPDNPSSLVSNDEEIIQRHSSTRSVPVTEAISPTQTFKLNSILKEAVANEKTVMMKNVMSFEELDEEDPSCPIIDRQPPSKKCRISTRGNPPPPAIILLDAIEFSDVETMENLFEDLESEDIANNIRIRGCPRVCFARNGHHIIVEQSLTPFGFQSEVTFNQFSTYAEKQSLDHLATNYRNVLEDQMTARLQQSEAILFSHFKDILSKKINSKDNWSSENEALKDEIMVWDLCSVLWPTQFDFGSETYKDDGYSIMKRKRFCQWIAKYAKDLFPEEWKSSGSSYFGYMKRGEVEDGALKAIKDGFNWTAVLMTTEPHLYLDISRKEVVQYMAIEKGNEDFHKFIDLLSGNFCKMDSFNKEPEPARSLNAESYLQYFAIYMWYEGKVESKLPVSIEESLKQFDGMVRQWNCSDQQIMTTECPSVARLCVHLLKLYSFHGYPMDLFLSPNKFSEDVLDYKMIWLLMTNLQLIGYMPTDETWKMICLQYAQMLESIGLWKWACFAMEFIPRKDIVIEDGRLAIEAATTVFCRRLMERNLKKNLTKR